MLSAAVAVAASAAIPTAKSTVNGQLSDLRKTGRIISESVAARAVAASESKVNEPRKAASRSVTAPKSIEDLCSMPWDASYTGMLNSNSGNHSGSASFVYNEEYDELDLILPDYSTSLYVGFDEETSSLIIYNSVGYGQNSQGYDIKLQPITTSGAPNVKTFTIPFNESTGAFEFPSDFAWGLLAYSGDSFLGYFWAAYKFTMSVADGDYTITPEISGSEVSADNTWTVKVEQGADVASVKCLVLPYDIDPSKYASLIASYGEDVINGTITVDPVNNNAEGQVMTESGFACALFASYDADGNLKKTAHIAFPVIFDDKQDGWATVGTVNYVDGIFSQYYQNVEYSNEVLVQAKTDNTPVYRFVTPYSAYTGVYDLAGHTHSMVIDATHPDWVAIPTTFSGLDLGGDGTLAFGSFAALGYDYNTAVANKLAGGTIEGNVVTFPTKTILAHEQFYNEPGSWSYVNTKSDITITLPAITVKVAAIDQTGKPAANINVEADGVAVTTNAEGIAVVEVPFSVGYFGQTTVTVDGTEYTVNLDGAENVLTCVVVVPDPWTSVGEAEWREGLLHAAAPFFFPAGLSWNVDVEESEDIPGIYRIKPYAVENTISETITYDIDEETVVYINATDPNKVYTTAESNFYPYEMCKFIGNNPENGQEGAVYGTLKNGVISFPEGAFILDDEYEGTRLLEEGSSFKIILPGATSEVERIEMGAIVGEVGEYIKVRPEVIVTDETLPAPAITWSSTNPEVAAVDEDGKVWFNAAGSATVIAECGGVEYSMPFEVEAVLARALNVFPVEAVGGKGHSLCLLAIHEPDNTTDKSVTWESEDPNVASVDETGRVELIGAGTTKITATSGEHTASCSITVDDTLGLTELASTGVAIDIVEGGINVRNAEEGASIVVYTIDGKVINGAVANATETHLDLAAGIYIVKVSPDTVAKVLIK